MSLFEILFTIAALGLVYLTKRYRRNAWIIAGTELWCPDCGAIRTMIQVSIAELDYRLGHKWIYPDGQTKALRIYQKYRRKERELCQLLKKS